MNSSPITSLGKNGQTGNNGVWISLDTSAVRIDEIPNCTTPNNTFTIRDVWGTGTGTGTYTYTGTIHQLRLRPGRTSHPLKDNYITDYVVERWDVYSLDLLTKKKYEIWRNEQPRLCEALDDLSKLIGIDSLHHHTVSAL